LPQRILIIFGNRKASCALIQETNLYIYKMGHEKVALLPFCTCPCDIVSGVSPPPSLVVLDRMLLATFSIFCDGLSFQHLAIVLISVFTLCYGPGLLFRGPLCVYIYILFIVARTKAWVCGSSIAGIVGSNTSGGMDVVCCQVDVSATN
jgi:hypothetical protein